MLETLLVIQVLGLPIALYFDAKQWERNAGKSRIFKIYSLLLAIVVLITVCTK